MPHTVQKYFRTTEFIQSYPTVASFISALEIITTIVTNHLDLKLLHSKLSFLTSLKIALSTASVEFLKETFYTKHASSPVIPLDLYKIAYGALNECLEIHPKCLKRI